MLRRVVASTALLVAVGVSASCSSVSEDLPERDFIRNQWAKSIGALGFNATYPPSEDIQVGDVYAIPEFADPDSEEAKKAIYTRPIKVASVDLSREIISHYAHRYQFGKTAEANEKLGYRAQPNPAKGKAAFNPGHNFNVPLQALPEFELARGSFGRVGAAIPLPFAGLFGSFASRESLDVVIKVPYAETYGLPAYDAMAAFKRFCDGHSRYGAGACTPRIAFAAVRAGSVQPADVDRAHVIMVSRVFATRSIEYNYKFTEGSAFAAQAIVTLDSAVKLQEATTKLVKAKEPEAPATGANVVVIKDASQKTASATRDEILAALLTQVSADLETLKASQAPGGYFTYARYGSNGISLKQVFERPIVIGFAAIRAGDLPMTQSQGPIGPRTTVTPRQGQTGITPPIGPSLIRPRPE